MIRGYLLALCSGASLDAGTNNFTLFNLIENVAVAPEGLGQTLPFELHFYCLVDSDARNLDFEMRVVRTDERGEVDLGEPLPFRTGSSGHFRLRALAFRLPKAFGNHLLRVEWRRQGTETWHEDPLVWPLSLALLPTPEAHGVR